MTTNSIDVFVPPDLDATRWENLEPLYAALVERPIGGPADLERLVLDRSELDAAASEAYSQLHINMTCHTDDAAAKAAFLEFVEKVQPPLKRVSFELDRKIAQSPHAPRLEQRRYQVLRRDLAAEVELFRDENVPLQTEETRLTQEYEELCGAMMVTFRGREHTLPQMARYLEETDRATREEAWRLVAERRLADRERLHTIYEAMLDLRHKMARNAGFSTYRDYAFKARHRFDYTPRDCEVFHRSVEEVCVPLYRELNAARAESLGVRPLRPWDLAVDEHGRAPLRPFQGAEELIQGTASIFDLIDPTLARLFESLRGGDHLDLESRKGKAPGGYQATRERRREPFIFMNASGRHDDVQTMLHEAGHAFHYLLCRHDPLVHYRHAPLEFAEVASMGMELLAQHSLSPFYDEEQAARARREHLGEVVRLLPWIATIDAFQHWIYTHPGHTRAQRTAQWLELDRRFGPAVSWEGLEEVRESAWQRQLHLYCVPFYYIEYGIAQLGALQLWLNAAGDRRGTLAAYQRALALGGSRPLPELFAAAGLRFDFGPATVRRLMDAVRAALD
jgi:oligoendopeptidase F